MRTVHSRQTFTSACEPSDFVGAPSADADGTQPSDIPSACEPSDFVGAPSADADGTQPSDIPSACEPVYTAGDWVAVNYDESWYPGIVENFVENLHSHSQILTVSFMARHSNRFHWPVRADRQQVDSFGILCKINTPLQISKRMFTLDEDEIRAIDILNETVLE